MTVRIRFSTKLAFEQVRRLSLVAGMLLLAFSAVPMVDEWFASAGGFGEAAFLLTWWPTAGYVTGWFLTRLAGEAGIWVMSAFFAAAMAANSIRTVQ
jgi:hypothetical protein